MEWMSAGNVTWISLVHLQLLRERELRETAEEGSATQMGRQLPDSPFRMRKVV